MVAFELGAAGRGFPDSVSKRTSSKSTITSEFDPLRKSDEDFVPCCFSLRKHHFASCSQFLWQHAVIDKLVYRGRNTNRPSLPHYRSVPEVDFARLPLGNIAL